MKYSVLIMFALASAHGQVVSLGDVAFQTLGNPVLQGVRVLNEGFGNQVVKGKPFSATEERHSLQVLGDGTRIENTQSNRLFRDADGRTRIEMMDGTIGIWDPITGKRVELDPATKTARHVGGAGGAYYSAARYGLVAPDWANPSRPANIQGLQGVMSETTENLGTQTINGVPAQGARTTMIIPKGQIGNSKDIKVVTERWSSNDLQMLVKSTNSDPRFGDTTYQLTKITQSALDPALFQIPADYAVTEAPGAAAISTVRGRAGAPGPVGRARVTPSPAPFKQQ